MLGKKAATSGRRSGRGIGRLLLLPAAASGFAGGGIGRLRLRPAIPVIPGGRGKKQRSAAAAAAPSLPDDALVDILSRVPAKSLCRFKCVSTAWRDLIVGRLRCTNLPRALEGFFYQFDGVETHGGGGGDNSDEDAPVVYGHFINTLGKPAALASLSFLGNVQGIQQLGLQRSCNGLLLFTHRKVGDIYNSLGYIVCNPATEQWVAVPSSGWEPFSVSEDESMDSDDSDDESNCCFTYLVFDPAVSPHFQLVELWTDYTACVEEVQCGARGQASGAARP